MLAFGHHEDRTPTHGYSLRSIRRCTLSNDILPAANLVSSAGLNSECLMPKFSISYLTFLRASRRASAYSAALDGLSIFGACSHLERKNLANSAFLCSSVFSIRGADETPIKRSIGLAQSLPETLPTSPKI